MASASAVIDACVARQKVPAALRAGSIVLLQVGLLLLARQLGRFVGSNAERHQVKIVAGAQRDRLQAARQSVKKLIAQRADIENKPAPGSRAGGRTARRAGSRVLDRHEIAGSSGSCTPSFWSNPTWLTTPPSVACAMATAGIDATTANRDQEYWHELVFVIVMASGPVWRRAPLALAGGGVSLFSAGCATRRQALGSHDLDRSINRDMGDPRLAVDPSISI